MTTPAASKPQWLTDLLSKNDSWSQTYTSTHSDLCSSLCKGQAPKILWIGCADSRVPETTVLNCQPGDVFTHRNIANIVSHGDLSAVSVIEYAVAALKVDHIVIAGHTSCGGVAGSLGNAKIGKIDTWLEPLRRLRYELREELKGKEGPEKIRLLVDANVKRSVQTVREMPDVIAAMQGRGLDVTGVVYDLKDGHVDVVDGPYHQVDAELLEAFSTS